MKYTGVGVVVAGLFFTFLIYDPVIANIMEIVELVNEVKAGIEFVPETYLFPLSSNHSVIYQCIGLYPILLTYTELYINSSNIVGHCPFSFHI